MKTWTWRILLAVVNVMLVLSLSPAFFRGLLAHSMSLYLILNCLNVVPFTVFNTIASYQISHHFLYWTHGYWARFLFWEMQAFIFLFWFWVGWKIDLRVASRDAAPAWGIVEAVLGLALSLVLLLTRPIPPAPGYAGVFRWVVMLWAVALFAYALFSFTRLWRAPRQRAH